MMPSAACRRSATGTAWGLAILFALVAGCHDAPPPPIRLQGTLLVVENQTATPWRDVSVTVNAYYRGKTSAIEPGAQIESSLSTLVDGFGHRFDLQREHVQRVEVRATDTAGRPVALDWDEKTDKPLAFSPR